MFSYSFLPEHDVLGYLGLSPKSVVACLVQKTFRSLPKPIEEAQESALVLQPCFFSPHGFSEYLDRRVPH